MLKNYLTTIFRILYRDRLFSFINIIGLATGIAACIFISVYVHYERSYDQHIDNVKNLYRVLYERESESGEKVQFASASPMIGVEMKDRFPEVLEAGNAYKLQGVISYNNISFREENMFWAEPAFLDLLSFRLIEKNGDSLLSAPNTAVISAATARKYFGEEDPINKIITLNGDQDFRIVGVFSPQPATMHFKADILLSWINWENFLGEGIKTFGWIYSGFYNYVRLDDGVPKEEVDHKITQMINDELGDFMEKYKLHISYRLQPVSDIHLTSHYMHELGTNGNRNSIDFLNIIAWFIIVIAWINFVNLLTISFTRRAGEIGLRKVLGGRNRQLIIQFIFESFVINLIALFISFVLIEQLSPLFYRITGIAPDYIIWNKWWVWLDLAVIFLTGTLLAGSYPAWGILTKKLSSTLKKTYTGSKKSIALQRGLVVFQFFMAVVLIAGTISVYLQIQYLHDSETGINKQQILVMHTPAVGDSLLLKRREAFKEEIKKYPFVKAITYSSVIPGKSNMMNRGGIRRVGEEQTKGKNYRITDTDYDFVRVFSNFFVTGRNFSKKHPSDKDAVIVNQTAARLLGFKRPEDAVHEKILVNEIPTTVIGVMENFHQESPMDNFEPQIFRLAQRFNGYFSVKLSNDSKSREIQNVLEKNYKAFFPGNPFDFFYLDDFYNQQYKTQKRFGKVFGTFSILALLITILGIVSLSSYTAVQRKKEIGIRKVHGASIRQILLLLSRKYVFLLFIACILAFPAFYLALDKWLDNFANRMSFTPWLMIIPAILVLVLSITTVIIQSLHTASENPADSLRYE